jgi:hypothetical protein
MTTRERHLTESETTPATQATSAETAEASAASRDTGDAFLRAADAAMSRALSGTPEAFLRQNRQLGGQ